MRLENRARAPRLPLSKAAPGFSMCPAARQDRPARGLRCAGPQTHRARLCHALAGILVAVENPEVRYIPGIIGGVRDTTAPLAVPHGGQAEVGGEAAGGKREDAHMCR